MKGTHRYPTTLHPASFLIPKSGLVDDGIIASLEASNGQPIVGDARRVRNLAAHEYHVQECTPRGRASSGVPVPRLAHRRCLLRRGARTLGSAPATPGTAHPQSPN